MQPSGEMRAISRRLMGLVVSKAGVGLIELRLADGLDGKGVILFGGPLDEVEAAVELATGALHAGDLLVAGEIISRVASELIDEFSAATRFRERAPIEADVEGEE